MPAHATSAKRLLRAGRGRLFGERPGCSCRTLLLLLQRRRRRRRRVMGRPSYSLPVPRCVSKRAASFTWLPTRCARQFPLPPPPPPLSEYREGRRFRNVPRGELRKPPFSPFLIFTSVLGRVDFGLEKEDRSSQPLADLPHVPCELLRAHICTCVRFVKAHCHRRDMIISQSSSFCS